MINRSNEWQEVVGTRVSEDRCLARKAGWMKYFDIELIDNRLYITLNEATEVELLGTGLGGVTIRTDDSIKRNLVINNEALELRILNSVEYKYESAKKAAVKYNRNALRTRFAYVLRAIAEQKGEHISKRVFNDGIDFLNRLCKYFNKEESVVVVDYKVDVRVLVDVLESFL